MNPSPLAIDASVAVKWVIGTENLASQARALFVDAVRADQALVGPPHLNGEVTNALYQRVRSTRPDRQITVEEARTALAAYLAMPVTLLSPAGLYEQALDFGLTNGLPSVYDSMYVTLARLVGAELWTADQRLLAALGGAAPWVRFIGDYPLDQ